MVQCIAKLMELFYIVRRNAITTDDLERIDKALDDVRALRQVFIETGVREYISLPRQHALEHYVHAIPDFGSPNGLCSSITEAKHIKAVKDPWRRSNRFHPTEQMVQTINRLDKLEALRVVFKNQGMLVGTTTAYMAGLIVHDTSGEAESESDSDDEHEEAGPDRSPRSLHSVSLAATPRTFSSSAL